MDRTVAIAAGPPCPRRYGPDEAVVVVDVIRSMTTSLTALDRRRRCFPVPTLEAALRLAGRLRDPLLAGELGGIKPACFELDNSPAALDERADLQRPLVLLSTSGTRLFSELGSAGEVYAACFRNWRATADWLAAHHERVTLIGALTRGELREEDQMCCAHLAERLLAAGFSVEDEATRQLIARWSGAPPDAFLESRSVRFLRDTGQLGDLTFILRHFDDLDVVARYKAGELVSLRHAAVRTRRAG